MNHLDKMKLDYVLELENITKVFPGVKALDNVNLRLKPGEVLALVGENGAGKSTLINCITGVYRPDDGVIRVDGAAVKLNTPQAAFKKGISVVHQERNLISTFNIAENIFLEEVCGKAMKKVDRKGMKSKAKELLKRVRLDLDPSDSIENLSSAQKQMIEIARALSINSHVLLLDEPTASISVKEADVLLDTIRELRSQGVAIIYVSHKLEEVFSIADRIKVLRDGKNVGDEEPTVNLTRDDLIERMVGQREMKQGFASEDRSSSEIVLAVEKISSRKNHASNSFSLRKGEIIGWYGLVGAGRTELAREIIGIDPIIKGTISINGRKAKIKSYRDAFEKYKISYLSENRKEEGLFISHSVARNISIVALDKSTGSMNLHSYKKEEKLAEKYKDMLNIKLSSTAAVVSSLSGGNQQKVCIAKCLATEPEIIIIDEPTVGIDVKTKAEIHKLIHDLSKQGRSIILISSDLPEIIQLSERIQVFRGGRIVGEMENEKDYDIVSAKVMDVMLQNISTGDNDEN